MRSIRWLEGRGYRGKWVHVAGAFALLAVVGLADYGTGPELSFTVFYFLPILLAGWRGGRAAGYAVSVASALVRFGDDVLTSMPHTHPLVLYWNACTALGCFVTVTYLLAAMRDAYDRERDLARIDHLTKVANRRRFLEIAATEIERARRLRHPFTVAYLDADNFKAVNDSLGHEAGDTLLRGIGDALRSTIRAIDTAARLGGDEFAVLFPEAGAETAEGLMQRIHENLGAAMSGHGWPVTFSVGLITFETPPESIHAMLSEADGLMYRAKRAGKNRMAAEVYSKPKGLLASALAS